CSARADRAACAGRAVQADAGAPGRSAPRVRIRRRPDSRAGDTCDRTWTLPRVDLRRRGWRRLEEQYALTALALHDRVVAADHLRDVRPESHVARGADLTIHSCHADAAPALEEPFVAIERLRVDA